MAASGDLPPFFPFLPFFRFLSAPVAALICLFISLAMRRMLRRIVEYQWFLIALSVL